MSVLWAMHSRSTLGWNAAGSSEQTTSASATSGPTMVLKDESFASRPATRTSAGVPASAARSATASASCSTPDTQVSTTPWEARCSTSGRATRPEPSRSTFCPGTTILRVLLLALPTTTPVASLPSTLILASAPSAASTNLQISLKVCSRLLEFPPEIFTTADDKCGRSSPSMFGRMWTFSSSKAASPASAASSTLLMSPVSKRWPSKKKRCSAAAPSAELLPAALLSSRSLEM
mmetsp:Transcript_42248/g.132308  ORF Transcript_42248/g.132308 Transcript_42248/m.132308 type:complete len:234 (+) Transcript_42248:1389-2090(+)